MFYNFPKQLALCCVSAPEHKPLLLTGVLGSACCAASQSSDAQLSVRACVRAYVRQHLPQSWALCFAVSFCIVSYFCASRVQKTTGRQSYLVFTFVCGMKEELSFMGGVCFLF